MIIDLIGADFAANELRVGASRRRQLAFAAAFAVRRRCDLAPDKPSRFAYMSGSIKPQRVARVA